VSPNEVVGYGGGEVRTDEGVTMLTDGGPRRGSFSVEFCRSGQRQKGRGKGSTKIKTAGKKATQQNKEVSPLPRTWGSLTS